MNACERDTNAVIITLSKAVEFSQLKGAVYTQLMCLLCKGSVSICVLHWSWFYQYCNFVVLVVTEELHRGWTIVESMPYHSGVIFRATLYSVTFFLPCYSSSSFAVC